MKIEPYYLLAPLPPKPSMPTRRAWLIAAGAFVVGSTVGSACGYSLGAASAGPAAAPAGPVEWKPSGDAELEEWRRLAVKAPLDELFERAMAFLDARVSNYPKDEILWLGVERLAKESAGNESRPVNEMTLVVVVAQIEGTARPTEPSLRELVPQLRARRERSRRR